jgi:hypothetical protein
MDSSWEIIYYEKADGNVPVEDFINTLTVKQAAKTKWEIDMLEKFGTALTMPYVRKISGENIKDFPSCVFSFQVIFQEYSIFCLLENELYCCTVL